MLPGCNLSRCSHGAISIYLQSHSDVYNQDSRMSNSVSKIRERIDNQPRGGISPGGGVLGAAQLFLQVLDFVDPLVGCLGEVFVPPLQCRHHLLQPVCTLQKGLVPAIAIHF